jgi:hypothetical protein
MGQYHMVVNLDKHEYIAPHELGCGLKLWEQIANSPNTGTALLILCACSNGRGGGDLEAANDVIGRWAGDRIAVVGDYAEDDDIAAEHVASTIYTRCGAKSVKEALDGYSEDYREKYRSRIEGQPLYRNITPMVAKVIEHELDGHFVGKGWKGWQPNKAA